MKKLVFISILFLSALPFSTIAQKLSSSPFSRYGVGELYHQANGRQIAMGNTGIGDFNSFHISKLNPASISSLKPNNVIFEIGLFDKISEFTNGETSQFNNITSFKHIMVGFRATSWWHTSFGVTPYSGVGYKMRLEDTLSIDDYLTPITNNYEGEGGINQLFWTNSFTFYNHFSLGATINYNFGSIDRISTSVISDSSYTSLTTNSSRNIFRKFNYDLGFVFADTIKKDEYSSILKYSIGGVFTNNYSIKSVETKYIARSISMYGRNFTDSVFFDTVATSSIMMPKTIGTGISLTLYDKYTFTGDYVYRNWSEGSVFGETNFVNSNFIGVGAEYVAAPLSTRYYKTIRYRIGAFQNNSYMSYNDNQITTRALTFGVGLPVKSVQVNLGFALGQTGSVDVGLLENFYEFNLNLSLYDIWFIKRKFM